MAEGIEPTNICLLGSFWFQDQAQPHKVERAITSVTMWTTCLACLWENGKAGEALRKWRPLGLGNPGSDL